MNIKPKWTSLPELESHRAGQHNIRMPRRSLFRLAYCTLAQPTGHPLLNKHVFRHCHDRGQICVEPQWTPRSDCLDRDETKPRTQPYVLQTLIPSFIKMSLTRSHSPHPVMSFRCRSKIWEHADIYPLTRVSTALLDWPWPPANHPVRGLLDNEYRCSLDVGSLLVLLAFILSGCRESTVRDKARGGEVLPRLLITTPDDAKRLFKHSKCSY